MVHVFLHYFDPKVPIAYLFGRYFRSFLMDQSNTMICMPGSPPSWWPAQSLTLLEDKKTSLFLQWWEQATCLLLDPNVSRCHFCLHAVEIQLSRTKQPFFGLDDEWVTVSVCFSLLQEACSLQYYFLILWRILGILPPSKAYMEQLKGGFSDPSESDILHTLRWSSRLRVSTYVNWIKVWKKIKNKKNTTQSKFILIQ